MPDTFVLDLQRGGEMDTPRTASRASPWMVRAIRFGRGAADRSDLLLAEFASLVAKRNRRKQISAEQALEAFSLMTKCAPRLFDMRPRLVQALDLSVQYRLSMWVCVYLALALERDCPLLTVDVRLFHGGRGRHPSIRLVQ